MSHQKRALEEVTGAGVGGAGAVLDKPLRSVELGAETVNLKKIVVIDNIF